jgi:hypothetical protein
MFIAGVNDTAKKLFSGVPRAQKKKTNALQVPPPR